jgi:hypothetical protein
MIFPSDSEIREYAAYEVRTRKIILEEFKHEYGREPNELEIPELLRAAIIPIGFLPKQNGFQKPIQDQSQNITNTAKNENKPSSSEQPKNQPAQQAPPKQKVTDFVMDIVYAHPELEIDGSRVVIKKKIESKNDYFDIKDELAKRGWKYVAPRHIGGDKWEPGYFEMEMKA